jgi:hypothetical protein
MTATIRYVTRRADGRESVRTATAAGPAYLVGRASGSDVHLQDLAVGLLHAKITAPSPGLVRVQSASAAGRIMVDRRFVDQAQFDLARGPAELKIGPFDLSIRATDGGGLQIDVARVQPQSADLRADKVKKVFSLRGAWLSKRASAWALGLTILLLGLTFPMTRLAPGAPVSGGADRAIAEGLWLAGETSHAHAGAIDSCGACHKTPFVSVEDETCVDCHQSTLHHADPGRMLRAQPEAGPFQAFLISTAELFGKPSDRCTACHTEHNGPDGVLPVADMSCVGCHAGMSERLADRDLGDAADFMAAHPEFRPTLSDVGAGPDPVRRWDIAALDAQRAARESAADAPAEACDGFEIGQANFRGYDPPLLPAGAAGDRSGLVFPHAVHLDKDGCVTAIARDLDPSFGYGEEGLGCADCHEADEARALFRPIAMERHCAACHSLTFDTVNGVPRALRHGTPELAVATLRDFYQARVVNRVLGLTPAAEAERFRPGPAGLRPPPPGRAVFRVADQEASRRIHGLFAPRGACFGCHVVTPPADGGFGYAVEPVRLRDQFLPAARFPHAPHETGMTCLDCHAAETSASAGDVLIPSIETCQTCHASDGRRGRIPSSCASCHGYHALEGQPAMSAETSALRAEGWTPLARTAFVGATHP